MRAFSFVIAFCLASVAAALPLEDFFEPQQYEERSVGYCTFDQSQFEGVALVGNPNGSPSFCESQWSAHSQPVSQVNIWYTSTTVEGIVVIYADGTTSPLYGSTEGTTIGYVNVNYAAGERWTQWTTWYNENGDGRVSAMIVKASNGQSIHAGYTIDQITSMGLYGLDQPVGSGFLFGIEGQSLPYDQGGGVTRIGAFFLVNAPQRVDITQVNFPNGPIGSPVTDIETLAQAHYYNSQTSSTSTWSFQSSAARMTSHTFTQTSTNTYGGSVTFSVSGGFAIIVSTNVMAGSTFMWSSMQGSMSATAESETTTITWNEGGTLQPNTGVDTQAIIGHGSGTFTYTSVVVVTLANGFQFSYPEDGTAKIDDVSTAVVTVSQDNNP